MARYRTGVVIAEDENVKVKFFVETMLKGGLVQREFESVHTEAVSRAMHAACGLPYQNLKIAEIKKKGR